MFPLGVWVELASPWASMQPVAQPQSKHSCSLYCCAPSELAAKAGVNDVRARATPIPAPARSLRTDSPWWLSRQTPRGDTTMPQPEDAGREFEAAPRDTALLRPSVRPRQ